ncbi:MAG: RagB/SusD family nutrient uptake outer membrane protein [Mangrovibacterium sp.]
MKRAHKLFIFLVLAAWSIESCQDDLNITPTSTITVASYWQTEEDAEAALYGTYTTFRNAASCSFGVPSLLFAMGEARSETMATGQLVYTTAKYYIDSDFSILFTGPEWTSLYRIIHNANLVLKYVPGIEFTSQAKKDNILAQAYAIRAFLYFRMVQTWGDLPLRLEPIETVNQDVLYVERTPKSEIFKVIKDDIDKAITLFGEDNSFPDGRNVWSKPAVNALKADVYLWTAKVEDGGNDDFTTALNAVNEVETSDVGLLDDFSEVFTEKGNQEILFAFYGDKVEGAASTAPLLNFQFNPAGIPDSILQIIGPASGSGFWSVSDLVANQFTSDDQRKNATFCDVYTVSDGVESYYGRVVVKTPGIVEYNQRKFIDDYPIYRYAEVLLMKAEAKNALGQDPSAEINRVRERAYKESFGEHTFVNGSKTQNDEAILKERLLELVTEGKRWHDLVRFGKVFELVPALQDNVGDDYLLLFPLSKNILAQEPKIKQNPGYEF